MIKTAILIVTWNKCHYVSRLLDSLKQLKLNSISIDIFVVDNYSTDNTSKHISENYPEIKLLHTETNIGGSGGFSFGLSHISELEYEYIWLLDDDITVSRNALISLVKIIEKYPDIGAAGSQIRQLDNPEFINEIGGFFDKTRGEVILNYNNESIEIHNHLTRKYEYQTVDYCAAASLLIRTAVVREIGVFKNYFLHFDDVEYCLRMKKHGWKVVAVPKSIIWHIGQQGKPRSWVRYYSTRNALYIMGETNTPVFFILKYILKIFLTSFFHLLMGRYFLSKIYLMAIIDFTKGIEGKSPFNFPYKVIPSSHVSNIFMQSNRTVLLAPTYKKAGNNSIAVFGDWKFLKYLSKDVNLFLSNINEPLESESKNDGSHIGKSADTLNYVQDKISSGHGDSIQAGYSSLCHFTGNLKYKYWNMPRGIFSKLFYAFYLFFFKKFDVAVTSLKNPDSIAPIIAKKTYYLIEDGAIESEHTAKKLISNLLSETLKWVRLFPSLILKVRNFKI